jgi:hypothetical protein
MIIDGMTATDRIECLENLLKLEQTTLESVTEQRDLWKAEAERYRLDANRLEAEVMILKEKLKEYDDTLTVCTDNFSCKTFVPQKWELPPYDEQGKGTYGRT